LRPKNIVKTSKIINTMKKCKTNSCKTLISPDTAPNLCPYCQDFDRKQFLRIVDAVESTLVHYKSKLDETRAMIAQAETIGSGITTEHFGTYLTKLKTRRACYGEIVISAQWLLSKKRSWMRRK